MHHYLFDMKSHDPQNRELVVKVQKVCEELSYNLETTTSTEKACAYVREINECLALMETISLIDSSGSRKIGFLNSPHGPFASQPSFNRWDQPSQASPWNQAGRWGQTGQAHNSDRDIFENNFSPEFHKLLGEFNSPDVEDAQKLEEFYTRLNERISACLTPGKQNAFKQFIGHMDFDMFQEELLDQLAVGSSPAWVVKKDMLNSYMDKVVLFVYDMSEEQRNACMK